MESEERVIVCKEPPYNGKWFYVKNGIKRWITSFDAAKDKGIDISDIEIISAEETNKYCTGSHIVKIFESIHEITNYHEARAYFLKDLIGYGVEFGAATTPTTVPDNCTVEYADISKTNEGCNSGYNGDFVNVKYFTSLEEMKDINSNSLDFIINCHVIEHSPRTILAIKNCFDRLKPGGTLFMAVPHMEYTFYSLRPLTTIKHFVQDYTDYIKERDLLHLVDYWEHRTEYDAKQKGIEASRMNLFPILDNFIKGEHIDIHYHTFTEENFTELLDFFNSNIAKWSKTEIIPRIPFEGSNEFYVRSTK